MQTNEIGYEVKKNLIPRISKYKKLHKITNEIYQNYCTITGNFHVLPDFYIVGGQKCGTTSMFMYLAENPYIKTSTVKDIRFFDKYFYKGENWYRKYFPLKIQKKNYDKKIKNITLTIDATERYLDHPHAAKRINSVTPNAKFIVLLRNPIDRAYSHYTMISNRSNIEFKEKLSFEEAIEKEESRIREKFQRMRKDEKYYSDDYFRFGYLDRGIYVDKLKRWMEIFPKERFLILQSEEFFKNTSEVYKQVIEFLGLPDWKPNEFVRYKKRKYKQEKMKPETRKKLIEYFKPHNQELYKFLGIEFDWDKKED